MTKILVILAVTALATVIACVGGEPMSNGGCAQVCGELQESLNSSTKSRALDRPNPRDYEGVRGFIKDNRQDIEKAFQKLTDLNPPDEIQAWRDARVKAFETVLESLNIGEEWFSAMQDENREQVEKLDRLGDELNPKMRELSI